MSVDDETIKNAREMPDLRSLMTLDDVEFVCSAYMTLLRRPADPQGLEHYARRLRSGSTKTELVAAIHGSPEGQAVGLDLGGLKQALQRYKLLRLPFIGRLLSFFANGEGRSPTDRRMRAVEQLLLHQEAAVERRHAQLLQEIKALGESLLQDRGGARGHSGDGDLVAQVEGRAPSLLSGRIKMRKALPGEVMAQLGAIVQTSIEAEQLAQNLLLAQPRGELRSVLSRRIKLRRALVTNVIAQLSEVVESSLESKLLGARSTHLIH